MLSLLYSPRKDILEQVNASEIFSLHCAVSEHLPALQAGIDMPKQPVNCILVEGCEENKNKMILIFFFTCRRVILATLYGQIGTNCFRKFFSWIWYIWMSSTSWRKFTNQTHQDLQKSSWSFYTNMQIDIKTGFLANL